MLRREKNSPEEKCAKCAERAVDLMLHHRLRVLEGIRERLGQHGFDAETTYHDWLQSLQRIAEISRGVDGNCRWSAPVHADDAIKSAADADRFIAGLDKLKERLDREDKSKAP